MTFSFQHVTLKEILIYADEISDMTQNNNIIGKGNTKIISGRQNNNI